MSRIVRGGEDSHGLRSWSLTLIPERANRHYVIMCVPGMIYTNKSN